MKKRILSFLLAAFLLLSVPAVAIANEEDPVTAIDGAVTVRTTTQAEAGSPVLLFILPAIMEGEGADRVDVTVSKVAAVNNATSLAALDAERIVVVTAGEDGLVQYNCRVSDDLGTGLCHVVISYLNAEDGCYSIGTFEHVGRNDVTALLTALNEADATTCGPVIDADINGEFDTDEVTRLEAKEILRKSSADTAYYETLTDKTAFHQIFYLKKGTADFTSTTMVSAFNEAGVWLRLRTEEDTLSVLNTYNGEGADKFWNLSIGDTSDFAALGDEQAAVLSAVKDGDYTDTDELEADFRNLVLTGMFRNLETREELAELIAETHTDAETGESIPNPYAADFAGVRAILAGASLDEFKLISVQNAVLLGRASCHDIASIETLFTNSLPPEVGEEEEEEEHRGVTTMGPSGRQPVLAADADLTPAKDKFPFKDVAANHWAKAYIQELYDKGAINGTSADAFNADGNIYRQDFVKILVGALEMTVSDSASTFSDVPEDAYYKTFVMTAYENGLIQGVGDGFGVGANITRQDAAVILSRVLEKKGIATASGSEIFADDAQISDYAKNAVAITRAAGIFGGDNNGNFNPKSYLSRAETCAIICRLAKLF